MKLPTNKKPFSFRSLFINIALIFLLQSTSCECNAPIDAPTPPLDITAISYDPDTNLVTCTVENQYKEDVDDITVHWQAEAPDAQITQSGKVVQEMAVGLVKGEASKPMLQLGQLNWGKNTSATFTFWLTRTDDSTHYSEQSRTFQRLVSPVHIKLVAVGPTILVTEKKKTFKAQITTTTPADKKIINPALIQLHITKAPADSPAKVLYKTKEVTTPLPGSDLGNIWAEIAFEVQPAGQEKVEFSVKLTYDGQKKEEVHFEWYKYEANSIQAAIRANNVEVITSLLKDRPALLNIQDQQGNTLFHLAATDSKEQVMKVLLSAQRPSNTAVAITLLKKNKDGKTAWQIANDKNATKIVEQLKEAGADQDITQGQLPNKLKIIVEQLLVSNPSIESASAAQ